jgi:subtilisin family serine protease
MAIDPALLQSVLTDHGLLIEDAIEEHGVYRVRDPQERDRTELALALRADLRVQGFEVDRPRIVTDRPSGLSIDQSTDAILETLRHDERVPYYGTSVPRAYVEQAAATLVGLEAAHARSTGTTIVAVIDTGVDPDHPALRGVITPGFDFTRDVPGTPSAWSDLSETIAARLQQSTDAILEQARLVVLNQSTAAILGGAAADTVKQGSVPSAFGHGTMVAGLVHLVAPTASIMPLKVFRADGSAELYDIVRAVYYAVDHGARVINMSFSMSARSIELGRAVRYAHDHGAVLVSSAGNGGQFVEHLYPAASDVVLGVASTSNGDLKSAFSNYGNDTVDIAAPGEALLTTYPGGGYALVWGTSFSAALASGGASLLVEGTPRNSHDEAEVIEESMLSAQPVGAYLGAGRIDLPRALRARDLKAQ